MHQVDYPLCNDLIQYFIQKIKPTIESYRHIYKYLAVILLHIHCRDVSCTVLYYFFERVIQVIGGPSNYNVNRPITKSYLWCMSLAHANNIQIKNFEWEDQRKK